MNYSFTTGNLTSGRHEICITAHGNDNGGTGSVTDCVYVIINDPPAVDPSGPYAGQEGTPVPIAGLVTDPDGPSLTTQWSATPASGVDPGATCAFADVSALSTTVTCTDDGVWTLNLNANDGLHPDVVASTQLTLTNVAPQASISSPADGTLVRRGTPVSVTAPFTDIATNDTHTCTVDFDDGTPVVAGTGRAVGALAELRYLAVPFDELVRRLDTRDSAALVPQELLAEYEQVFEAPDDEELALFDHVDE